MSTEVEKLPLWLTGEGVETRVADVAAAFRELAILRLAEQRLPGLIADTQAAADAAIVELGLGGIDHRTFLSASVNATEGGAMPPAGGKPRHHQPDAEPTGGNGDPAADVPDEVLAGDPPAASETESAAHAGAAEAEAHTPAEGAVEPEVGSVPVSGSPLTTQPAAVAPAVRASVRADAERRGGRPLGDVSQACLRVLELAHPHPATAADIVTASGYSLDKVRQRLYALSSSGRVTRDDSKGEPLWTLAVEHLAPVVGAALAAAGEVAGE